MTLREKQRLHRIIAANAGEYRDARREIALRTMRGSVNEGTALADIQRRLTSAALGIAEAVATLEDHAEER